MRRFFAVVLVAALATSGCSLVGGGGGGSYKLVAYFPRAVSLYPSSQVRVLGLPAGRVDGVDVIGTQVKVSMSINNDIPVPKDVKAFIVPQSLHFSVFAASSSPSPSPACGKMGAGAGVAARTELGARGVSVGMTG